MSTAVYLLCLLEELDALVLSKLLFLSSGIPVSLVSNSMIQCSPQFLLGLSFLGKYCSFCLQELLLYHHDRAEEEQARGGSKVSPLLCQSSFVQHKLHLLLFPSASASQPPYIYMLNCGHRGRYLPTHCIAWNLEVSNLASALSTAAF